MLYAHTVHLVKLFSTFSTCVIGNHSIVCLFGLVLNVPVNSYGHVGMVSSRNHTFFSGKLDLAVNQYFVHILLLVTDNNPS